MCVSPATIQVRGLATKISCRQCWQCRSNRVRDLVGRCIAESKDAVGTSVITLTYGTDNKIGPGKTTTLSAVILTYSDVQKWLKRLRKDGYPLRYVIAGEYGSLKGRAHWHVIAFWQKRVPPHPDPNGPTKGKWWDDPWWTAHPDSAGGYSHWGEFTPQSAGYVCKYLLKAENDPKAQSMVRRSKHPVLGYRFFERLAAQYVEQGLTPDRNRYSFPDVIDKRTRKPRLFSMSRAALDYFLVHYLAQWRDARGGHPMDRLHSDTVWAYMDRMARVPAAELMERRRYMPGPKWEPVDLDSGEVYPRWFDEKLNCFVTQVGDGSMRYWSHDEWGNRTWTDAIRNAGATGTVVNLSTGSVEPLGSQSYRAASRGT